MPAPFREAPPQALKEGDSLLTQLRGASPVWRTWLSVQLVGDAAIPLPPVAELHGHAVGLDLTLLQLVHGHGHRRGDR